MSLKGKNVAKDNVSIDSFIGIYVGGSSAGVVEVRQNAIYGSQNMPNLDCPDPGATCECVDRKGVLAPTFGTSKPAMKNTLGILKMFLGSGDFGGESFFVENSFIGFDNPTNHCGGKQAAIGTN